MRQAVSSNVLDSCECAYCDCDMTDRLDDCKIIITAQKDDGLWTQLLKPVCDSCRQMSMEDPFV